MSKMEFGKQARAEYYALDSRFTFTNHGSFGSSPKPILEKRKQLQEEMEARPDEWFRWSSFELYKKSVNALRDYLKLETSNGLVICENATESINSVLKSIEFDDPENQVILATNYTYAAILNSIDYTAKHNRAGRSTIEIFELKTEFPLASTQQLLDELDRTCERIVKEKRKSIKLAVFDHISSMTAMLFPVTEMNKIVRKWDSNSLILVDGAHALGQTEIDLAKLNCDFYVSNLHKWFLAPRGCSFLYLKNAKKLGGKPLQPCYISHGYNSDTVYNFYRRGTSDNTTWFVAEDCIDLYTNLLGGLDNVTTYCESILKQAVELLVTGWGTRTLEIPSEMEAPFMKVILMPESIAKKYPSDQSDALMRDLNDKYNIVACVVTIQDQLYCRISCFVYNSLDDFIILRDAVLKLASE